MILLCTLQLDHAYNSNMWQRFSERARKVVFYAQEEAQKFGEGYVSTEHLLLGILREDHSSAGQVLTAAGISAIKVRLAVESQLPKGDARPPQDMTLTPRAKRVIDLAYDEARHLNHNYIGTEHLLLGLIREGDGLAGRVLAKFGAELEAIREIVVATVGMGKEVSAAEQSDYQMAPHVSGSARKILNLRRNRMVADYLCLMFLYEVEGEARRAVLRCGSDPETVVRVIEEALFEKKPYSELVRETLGATELLNLAIQEAKNLNQELKGIHFLLAAMVEGSTETAKTLEKFDIGYDALRSNAATKD